MRILVIGGTQFIGRHLVSRLRRDGHSLTLLNRGTTNPHLFPELPRLHADRNDAGALERLPGLASDWDAAIDLSGLYPKSVRRLLNILKGRCGRYVFCSTISVYQALNEDSPIPLLAEDAAIQSCSTEQATDQTMSSYGPRKAQCERVALEQHTTGVPVVIIRPAVVFGADDHTDRMAYWIARAMSERPFILPDAGLTVACRAYAPDLADAFPAALVAPDAVGNAFNIAETEPLNLRDTMLRLGEALGTRPLDRAVCVAGDQLLMHGVRQWVDIPLWLCQRNFLIDTFRARRDLGFVSAQPAIALAHAAAAFRSGNRSPRAGLTFDAESDLLAKCA